ncbi:MAG: S-layer homology domain-containing protein [Actinobacteria bacterium]|nr:S-layer homology domain-containing protein [Actinomycetota bacterium]
MDVTRLLRRRTALTVGLMGISLACLLLLLNPASALATGEGIAGWQFTKITETAHYPFDSMLNGGRLFWARATQGNGSELLCRDLASGTDSTLVSDELSPRSFDVDGDRVAFTGYDGVDAEVFVLTISTGQITKLTNNTWDESRPKISGDLVAWDRHEYDFNSSNFRLFACDLESGTTIELASTDPNQSGLYDFQVDGDWVVWQIYSFHNEQTVVRTWAYSRATGETAELAGPWTLNSSVTLAEGKLYFASDSADRSDLYAMDLATREGSLIASNDKQIQSIQVSGNKIAWASWYTASGPSVSYLAILDSNTGQTTRISTPGYSAGQLDLSGNVLAWWGQSLAGAYLGMHNYLFVYDIARATVTRLTSPRENIQPNNTTDGESVTFLRYHPSETRLTTELVVVSPSDELPLAFADISGVHPYRTAIVGMAEKGFVSGYPTGAGEPDFRPNAQINRAQFCKLLAEVLGLAVTEDLLPPFSDLGTDDLYSLYPHEYVAALTSIGAIRGMGGGRFSPYSGLSRAQLVTMIVRAVDKLEPGLLVDNTMIAYNPGTLGGFDPIHWKNMARAEITGLLDGLAGFGKRWDPWKPASRGEAAQILWNLASMDEGTP